MSITINTNLSSLVVQLSMKGSTIDLNRAIERMTTGYKINSAKDDAAGYAVVTGMNTQLGAYRVAETNATTGLDMVSTAVNTLDMMSSQLSRLRSLAVQAQNGTYGSDSVSALNMEADTITNSLNRLMNSAEYNGKKLFNGMELPAGFTPIDSPKAGASGFIDESFTRTDTSSIKTLTSAVTDGETIKGGTWAIGSVEDLVKLAELTNTSTDNTTGTTFVLSEDIDLSSIDNWTPIGDYSTNTSYRFRGKFDGNGHVIKNLKINNPSKGYQGLFGQAYNATIQNVGLENVNITGQDYVGGLVGDAYASTLTNCYATGNVSGLVFVGGLAGVTASITLSNSYATADVTGQDYVGGLVGNLEDSNLTNCYATGDVTGNAVVGGLAGVVLLCTIDSSVSYSKVTGTDFTGSFIGAVMNTGDNVTFYDSNITNCKALSQGLPAIYGCAGYDGSLNTVGLDAMLAGISEIGSQTPDVGSQTSIINLQIGIDSSSNSQITFDTSIKKDLLGGLSGLDLTDASALSKIDAVIQDVTAKQAELGAVQNRLESVLDSISVQYDNLVSARSTVRDADVAKESATYIKSQILQNASATLLATANQSPSLALTLIGGLQRRG